MSDIKPLPCFWCHCETDAVGFRKVFVRCSNLTCDAMGPNSTTIESAVDAWNRIASLPDQHARAIALLRRVLDGPRPTHGPLDVYDDIAAFLRETDNG